MPRLEFAESDGKEETNMKLENFGRMMKFALVLLAITVVLAGCSLKFQPLHCYKFPKYEWDKCPFPPDYPTNNLPAEILY